MSSFISSLTSRKKSPEKLVRLAMQCLSTLAAEEAAAAVAMQRLSIITSSSGSGSAADGGSPATPRSSTTSGPTSPHHASSSSSGLDADAAQAKRVEEANAQLCKRLSQMKAILYGSEDKLEIDEHKAEELSLCIQSEGLLLVLVHQLNSIPFEARKDTAQIFNNLIHKNICNFAGYVEAHFSMVLELMGYYTIPDVALTCGTMLRECIRYDDLARAALDCELLWAFFDTYVHLPNFDAASDAFNTLRDLLTTARNKLISSEFLERHYDKVFTKYELMLHSENYVTRRRSLKLLGELLLDRSNFNVMMRFISERKNLQLIMNLLRDKSPNIQFEAFHVFKVFVANPKKPVDIAIILYKNREKLIAYLNNFHLDREDAQFVDEKRLLIETLTELQRPLAPSPSMASTPKNSSSGGAGSAFSFPDSSIITAAPSSHAADSVSPGAGGASSVTFEDSVLVGGACSPAHQGAM